MEIPVSGTVAAVDKLANAAVVAGTDRLSIRCRVGLQSASAGDVAFSVRLRFDNGSVALGEAMALGQLPRDEWRIYESEVAVPSGAERLVGVELAFDQREVSSLQTGYVDDVEVKFASGFNAWKSINGIGPGVSDSSDADGDRLSLLLEYGLNLDPSRVSGLGESVGVGAVVDGVGGGVLSLTYRPFRSDVVYTVTGSDDLTDWSTDGVAQGTPNSTGFTTAHTPMLGDEKFLRLNVSRR
ncbi:MAG: hypothetical protein WA771_02750 [Chthoniobacterales bacterium]